VRIGVLIIPLLLTAGMIFMPANSSATTIPSLIVAVNVTLTPHAVSFSAKRAPRGNYVQFRVRNTTAKRHTFSLASRSIVVPARRDRLLVIYFDARGRYTYVSRTPQKAIHGTFRID
jgi:hypothetical protein